MQLEGNQAHYQSKWQYERDGFILGLSLFSLSYVIESVVDVLLSVKASLILAFG